MNPFEDLLVELQSKAWNSVREKSLDPLTLLCLTQVRLLCIQYRSMSEFDMRDFHFKDDKSYFEHSLKTTKSVLDYYGFISLLNQFGRILDERFSIDIPLYSRIRFFRNKVSEHWDEYTEDSPASGSLSQKFGKPAIPSISLVYAPEERKALKSQIDAVFSKFGVMLELDSIEASNYSIVADNSERVYLALEKIHHLLHGIPDELVTLFFKFGFPIPILEVEDYSSDLVVFLREKLGLLVQK
jgi:hypothetical protein